MKTFIFLIFIIVVSCSNGIHNGKCLKSHNIQYNNSKGFWSLAVNTSENSNSIADLGAEAEIK